MRRMDDHHQKSVNSGEGCKNPSSESSSADSQGNIISGSSNAPGAPLGADVTSQPTNEGSGEAVEPYEIPEGARQQINQSKSEAAALQRFKSMPYRAVEAPSTPVQKRVRESDTMQSPKSAFMENTVKPCFEPALKRTEDGLNERIDAIQAQVQLMDLKLDKVLTIIDGGCLVETFNEIKRTVQSVKESVDATTVNHWEGVGAMGPTYAQMASRHASTTPPASSPNNLIITLHQVNTASPVMAGEEYTQLKIKQVMNEKISESLSEELEASEHHIKAGRRLPTNTFKLHAQNAHVADTLKANTSWIPEGLRLHKITHEVAVLRAPTTVEPAEFARGLEDENEIIRGHVVFAKWAKRSAKKQKYATIKIQVDDISVAKHIINYGLYRESMYHVVQAANLIPRQCTNCGKLRHTRQVCRSKAFCERCKGAHPTDECDKVPCKPSSGPGQSRMGVACSELRKCTHNVNLTCAICPEDKEGHSAFSNQCPARKRYLEDLTEQNNLYKRQLGEMDGGGGNYGANYYEATTYKQ